ncbi:MAG: NAD+ synthase [Armatimonadota bacterium]|nr:NAD+ synthase [Armatimonadota bacterium]
MLRARQFSNPPPSLRLALVQMNPTVGDLEGNANKILDAVQQAKEHKADVVVFPELALTGYPPEDLLLKPQFTADNLKQLEAIAPQIEDITAVIGFVDGNADIFNAAAIIHNGEIAGIHHKFYLPTYGVFDEDRYFQKGNELQVFKLKGVTFGVSVCEDIWYPEGPHRIQTLLGDAELIININASPFHSGKWIDRERMLSVRAADNDAVVAYVNTVGGQDELVFDGHSLVINPNGEIIARGRAFEEEIIYVDVDTGAPMHRRLIDPKRRKEKLALQKQMDRPQTIKLVANKTDDKKPPLPSRQVNPPERVEEVYSALTLGLRDYVRKNQFKGVVLGLSGGIDSALTAAIAADALGNDAVTTVSMPSEITSSESKEDAEALAKNFGIKLLTIPIKQVFESYKDILAPAFAGLAENTTEENLQARTRGNILMALSNKFGWLVLTTGNKSEMACGYATLYGDMAGGFAVIKDVPKTLVYELANYRNRKSEVIPRRIIEKEPTAELRPGQKDVDSLPPYSLLDPILRYYVEEDRSVEEIIHLGFDEAIVRKVARMVDRNEYKRRQAPPGVKITPKAFGRDRRLPITNWYTCDRCI